MRDSVKQMLESNGYGLFAVIAAIYLAINLFTNTMVLTDGVLYDSFLGQMPEHQIERAIAMQHKWSWLSYALLPLIIGLRQLFASAFIAMGTMLGEQGITFKQVYKSVLLSEPPGWPEAAAVTMRTISLRTCDAIWGREYSIMIVELSFRLQITNIQNKIFDSTFGGLFASDKYSKPIEAL